MSPIHASRSLWTSAAAGFDAATIAWVAAVVANGGTVSNARETIVDNLIVGLKADGIWSTKLDRLWLFAAENQPSALTDLLPTNTLATAVNSPSFTPNDGYDGDDALAVSKYINTHFNGSTAGGNYSRNSAHISSWLTTNNSPAGSFVGTTIGAEDGTTHTQIYQTYSGDGNIYSRINDSSFSGAQGVPPSRVGHVLGNRSGASTSEVYRNGSLFGSPNSSSGALANLEMYALCMNDSTQGGPTAGCYNRMAMASIGGNLNSTDAANFYSRLRTYMTAVGVP